MEEGGADRDRRGRGRLRAEPEEHQGLGEECYAGEEDTGAEEYWKTGERAVNTTSQEEVGGGRGWSRYFRLLPRLLHSKENQEEIQIPAPNQLGRG